MIVNAVCAVCEYLLAWDFWEAKWVCVYGHPQANGGPK